MLTDPVTLILTSAVVSALFTSAINGFVTWRNTTRTIDHQATQTRQTLDHQATQTQQTLTHQAEQTRLTMTAQVDQARLTDARALRDAKRERLRSICTPVLAAAWAMNDLIIEQKIHYADETDEKREASLATLMRQAGSDVNNWLVKLSLERDATELREAFFTLRRNFELYRNARFSSDDPASVDWDTVRGYELNVHNGATMLEAHARHHLHELDRPFPAT